ncbi:MAG: pentapeptide repeat-containing protein [Austwickia sp.]|nr:pentapeptide repeat-containing protein [Austwickia sp.]
MTLDLRADCSRCAGLCCVALPYQRSADFPESKPAGRPCRHLGAGAAPYACGIHDRLAADGWRGCVAFDCAGAGPHTVQVSYGGRGWDAAGSRAAPELPDAGAAFAAEQFATFRALLPIFELAWYVAQARTLTAPDGRAPDAGLAAELAHAADQLEAAAAAPPTVLATYHPAPLHALVAGLLRRAAAGVREAAASRRPLSADSLRVSRRAPGADLAGRTLRGKDLRGADLTGAVLLGADLRDADLDGACLLGADLRGCRYDEDLSRWAVFTPPGLTA